MFFLFFNLCLFLDPNITTKFFYDNVCLGSQNFWNNSQENVRDERIFH